MPWMVSALLVVALGAMPVSAPADTADLQAALEEAMYAYYYGDGTKARVLLVELAEQGCAKAQAKLAGMRNSLPEEERDAHALRWYRRAAKNGRAEAQFYLGFAHDFGLWGLGPREYDQAREWYLRAAEQGHPFAMTALGHMARDPIETHMWYTLAIPRFPPPTDRPAHGLGTDNRMRAMTEGRRDDFAEYLTPEQIAEAERLAAAWEVEHGYIRHMPAQSDEPLPLWYNAVEGPCAD
ncbi:MAG: hypothetical protein WD057_08270 [Aquisalimonadaceae bacterium]